VPLAGTGMVEAILTAAGPQLARVGAGSLVELCLIGPVAEPVDVEAVSAAVAARAGLLHVSVRDGTSLMGADQVRQWESESTLRGFFIRRMMQAAQASGAGAAPSEEESRIAERALRHGLTALERARR